jgi:Leucine-rich repeat (LRR) protein
MKIRRLLQYRLSSLLIAVTVCALGLGYFVNSRPKKRMALNPPMFHLESNGAWLNCVSPSPQKRLVEDRNGDYYEFCDYKALNVKLFKKDFDFGALRYLDDFPKIGELDFSASKITNADLVHLEHCPSAKVLLLHDTDLQDDDFQDLEKLRQLEYLSLRNTHVGDTATKSISRLSSLKGLDLSRTNVTDKGVQRISGMTGLQSLNLGRTPISKGALKHLGRLTNLTYLDLEEVDLSDADLSCLRSCTKLKQINLEGTRVTDSVFKQLPGLKMISLSGARTTLAARREFL